MNRYWHVYPREQIRPALAGDEVYALAVPGAEGAPLKSFVGNALRHQRIATQPGRPGSAPMLDYPYGMIFGGINRQSVAELEDSISRCPADGWDIACYNQRVISSARQMLLRETAVPKGVDALTFCLLRGLTHLLPSFESIPRVPITALKQPASEPGILIVEDEECQLELFRVLLESLGYRNLHLARDGTEALPILAAQRGAIDLILLNWEMPRMDGLTLMRHLARHYGHPVGVIMESGYPYNDYKREFFKLRSDSVIPIDYLVKPFLIKEFELEVKVAMEFMRRKQRRRS